MYIHTTQNPYTATRLLTWKNDRLDEMLCVGFRYTDSLSDSYPPVYYNLATPRSEVRDAAADPVCDNCVCVGVCGQVSCLFSDVIRQCSIMQRMQQTPYGVLCVSVDNCHGLRLHLSCVGDTAVHHNARDVAQWPFFLGGRFCQGYKAVDEELSQKSHYRAWFLGVKVNNITSQANMELQQTPFLFSFPH